MIILDMSNLVFSQVLDFHNSTKEQPDMSLIRNLSLGKIQSIKTKCKAYSGELVAAFDSRNYWRRDVFPYYKGKRKAARDKSTFDWKAFFPMFEQFKQEMKDYLPIKCIDVDGAEADDIMAVLAQRFGPSGDVCIVTSDKDMIQIQHLCPAVKQWSPWHAKFLTPKNMEYSLFEHIICGDTGDGVPNILSDDDCIMNEGKRQKPLRKTKIAEWAKYGINSPELFCPDASALDKFVRNRRLIDLREVPETLVSDIIRAYDETVPAKGQQFTYLTANRLTNILKEGGI